MKDFDPKTQIAIIWSIDDVRAIRHDLNDEDAMKVLQMAKERHDANKGITWDFLEAVADDIFPWAYAHYKGGNNLYNKDNMKELTGERGNYFVEQLNDSFLPFKNGFFSRKYFNTLDDAKKEVKRLEKEGIRRRAFITLGKIL